MLALRITVSRVSASASSLGHHLLAVLLQLSTSHSLERPKDPSVLCPRSPTPSNPVSREALGSRSGLTRGRHLPRWGGVRGRTGEGTERTWGKREAARLSATRWSGAGSPQHDRSAGPTGPAGRPAPRAGSGPDGPCGVSITQPRGGSCPASPRPPSCLGTGPLPAS